MALIAPGAAYRPVVNQSAGMDAQLGLILHVQQGLNSPYGWFNNPSSQDSSTWWVSKTGVLEQYGDPITQHQWAQAAGNRSYQSVETEGYPAEALTDAQVQTLAHLYAWGHQALGWDLTLAEAPGQRGFGWHGMGGTAWGGHLGCPGDLRRAQRQQILTLAQAIISGEDLPLNTDDKTWLEGRMDAHDQWVTANIRAAIAAAKVDPAALADAVVAKLPQSGALDLAAVRQAAHDGFADALAAASAAVKPT